MNPYEYIVDRVEREGIISSNTLIRSAMAKFHMNLESTCELIHEAIENLDLSFIKPENGRKIFLTKFDYVLEDQHGVLRIDGDFSTQELSVDEEIVE